MAKSTSLIAIDGELLVIHEQLAEQLDLLDLIVRWRCKPFDRLRLDAVDLGFDLRNFPQCLRREDHAALLCGERMCAHHSGHYHQHRDTTQALFRSRDDQPRGRAAEKRDELALFQLYQFHVCQLHAVACYLWPICSISNWRGSVSERSARRMVSPRHSRFF